MDMGCLLIGDDAQLSFTVETCDRAIKAIFAAGPTLGFWASWLVVAIQLEHEVIGLMLGEDFRFANFISCLERFHD